MRIRGWHIEGFGIHRDWQVDEVSPGLSVFYGPNEAGKSTLLAFLRGVLFGYPDGRSNEPKYVPRGGGAHGGRITLQTARGDVVVERYAGRGGKVSVTLADGRAGEASDLAALLAHADAPLFRAVFAFGRRYAANGGDCFTIGAKSLRTSAGSCRWAKQAAS